MPLTEADGDEDADRLGEAVLDGVLEDDTERVVVTDLAGLREGDVDMEGLGVTRADGDDVPLDVLVFDDVELGDHVRDAAADADAELELVADLVRKVEAVGDEDSELEDDPREVKDAAAESVTCAVAVPEDVEHGDDVSESLGEPLLLGVKVGLDEAVDDAEGVEDFDANALALLEELREIPPDVEIAPVGERDTRKVALDDEHADAAREPDDVRVRVTKNDGDAVERRVGDGERVREIVTDTDTVTVLLVEAEADTGRVAGPERLEEMLMLLATEVVEDAAGDLVIVAARGAEGEGVKLAETHEDGV